MCHTTTPHERSGTWTRTVTTPPPVTDGSWLSKVAGHAALGLDTVTAIRFEFSLQVRGKRLCSHSRFLFSLNPPNMRCLCAIVVSSLCWCCRCCRREA